VSLLISFGRYESIINLMRCSKPLLTKGGGNKGVNARSCSIHETVFTVQSCKELAQVCEARSAPLNVDWLPSTPK